MAYLFETDEHTALRAQIRRFAEREIAPHAHAWDEAKGFPRALYRQAAEAGLLGVGYPEALGGAGGDVTHGLVAFEELVLAGKSVGVKVGLGTHGIALPPILALGTEEQKRRFVPPVLAGEKIAALAITEPGAGCDVAAITTRARRDGDDYVVDGAKTFISSGCRADLVTLAVRTGGPGHGGLSLLVVERGTPGFTVSQDAREDGLVGLGHRRAVLRRAAACRSPTGSAKKGRASSPSCRTSCPSGSFLAGQCVAIAELAYREAVAYARERQAFGKPLTGFQVTRHKLADMASRLAAARALTGEVAVRYPARRAARRRWRRWPRTPPPTCAASSATRPSRSTAAPATCAAASSSACFATRASIRSAAARAKS